MIYSLKQVQEHLQGKPGALHRASDWGTIRRHHLLLNPVCILCGGKEKLEVHHILPFHLHPDEEKNPANLATLCESMSNGVNCHLWMGHLGNFKSFNPQVLKDALEWSQRIRMRTFE